MVGGVFRRAVQQAVGIDRRVALVGRDQVVKILLLVAPIPGRHHDIALDPLRPRRLGDRQFALGDAVGPVAEIFQRHAGELARHRVDHQRRGLAGLDAPRPGFLATVEVAELRRDGPRRQLAELMTADAGLVLDRGQPIGLRQFVGNVALAVELIRGRNLQHREPINRRIILRGGRVVGRRRGGEVQTLARLAVDLGGIDQAIAAHPYFIFGFRQVRQHVAALVVGHHHLGKTGAEVVGFRDHPDAGFGAVRAFDDAADRFAVDRDILRAQAHRCCDEERRHRNRRHAAKQCSLHADLPEESVRGDKASPMHVVILRDFAPGATHPQGDFAAAMPPCGQVICFSSTYWRRCSASRTGRRGPCAPSPISKSGR